MDNLEKPIIRSLIWLGNTKRKIKTFPEEVKKLIGDELQIIQFGGMPKDAKPMNNHQEIEFEQSSGNVFADLGLDNAPELFTRAQIGFHVYQILKQRNLKQREIAKLLGISQSDVSHLMNGHFSQFTTDKLLDFLKHLNMKVTIYISPHQEGEAFHQVAYIS